MRLQATIEAAFAAASLAFFRWFQAPADPPFTVCGFFYFTGLPCPLCGMTRGLCAAAKGDFMAAVSFHALSPAVLVLIAAWGAAALWRIGGRPVRIAFPWRFTGAVFLAYGAVRILGRTL